MFIKLPWKVISCDPMKNYKIWTFPQLWLFQIQKYYTNASGNKLYKSSSFFWRGDDTAAQKSCHLPLSNTLHPIIEGKWYENFILFMLFWLTISL